MTRIESTQRIMIFVAQPTDEGGSMAIAKQTERVA